MAKKKEMSSGTTTEQIKKIGFKIKGVDSIVYTTPIKKVEADIDPRTVLSLEEAIKAMAELKDSIDWCRKWQDNINIWGTFLKDIDMEIKNQENIMKEVKKTNKNLSGFDEYYRISVSMSDFTTTDALSGIGEKLNNEIITAGINNIDLVVDGDIITFLSKDRDAIRKVCHWFYYSKVSPVIEGIKKLK